MEESLRLQRLPEYVFSQLDRLKEEEVSKGKDLIDLGMGNPDLPTPKPIVDAMIDALKNPANFRYPTFDGLPQFCESVAKWNKRKYNVNLDPKTEVTPLIGSKEGLIHFALAFVNPGDTTLVPLPAYPAHFNGTILAGGTPIVLPTTEKNGFIPDLDIIDDAIAKKAKMLILSYPSNPTASVAPKSFFEKAVAFAKKHNIILVHDFAYAELYFDGKKLPSMLEIHGAKDVCIEFQTCSKTFSMPGWRIGFAVGNKNLIASLRRIKTNLDYGVFLANQRAAIAALNLSEDYLDETRKTYQRRRDIFVEGLNKLGWNLKKPQATMYIWVPVPTGYSASSFSLDLLKKTGVVAAPGIAFGDLGEGFVRFALVDKECRLEEALVRMEKAGIRYA